MSVVPIVVAMHRQQLMLMKLDITTVSHVLVPLHCLNCNTSTSVKTC